jgi:hypothetical protein
MSYASGVSETREAVGSLSSLQALLLNLNNNMLQRNAKIALITGMIISVLFTIGVLFLLTGAFLNRFGLINQSSWLSTHIFKYI